MKKTAVTAEAGKPGVHLASSAALSSGSVFLPQPHAGRLGGEH